MSNSASDGERYLEKRTSILRKESLTRIGGSVNLTQNEIAANKIILNNKLSELRVGHENIIEFLPARHFFHARSQIEKSRMFSILRNFPKGCSLHTHMLAAVKIDYIVEKITFRSDLCGCIINDAFKLRFLASPDDDSQHPWKLLSEYRAEDPSFDVWLRQQLSLEVEDPVVIYSTPHVIWQRFKRIFTAEYDMLCYKPVFQDYINQLLIELYEDNIFYCELRGTFMPLYELDGTVYSNKQFFEIFIDTVEEFKRQHPDFQGVRYIHSIYRGVSTEVLKAGLDELISLKRLFPNFVAGFDFVGYEEEGNRLVDYHEILLEASKELKFFFHAGETSWYGNTDLNLLDAILLNCCRIGHGFGLPKHPTLVSKPSTLIETVYDKNQELKF